MLRGVDVSEFTREIPPSWWEDLRDEHNVEVAIIQCWGGGPVKGRYNTYFEQQARGALDAGLRIGTYCWPPRDVVYAVNFVRDNSVPLRVFALDVEAGAIATPDHAAVVVDAGFDPWLYGNYYTIASLPDRDRLRDLPLWLARYIDEDRAVWWSDEYEPYDSSAPIRSAPIPQWPNPQGWQFQGTTAYRGETMDLNLFRKFPGDEHMPTPEYDELKAALEATNALLVIVAGRLEALRKGDVDVPIWPVGEVPLKIVRHRGYHAGDPNV